MTPDWPNLPIGIKNGLAARWQDLLVVGLGSAGADLFALNLLHRDRGWQKLCRFPGPSPEHPAVAVSGNRLLVFGGAGKPDPAAASPIVFDTVHCYDFTTGTWARLDTVTPAGLLGANAVTLRDGRVALIGGYNKPMFDAFVARLAAIDPQKEPALHAQTLSDYMSMTPDDYRWNPRVLGFDASALRWFDFGANPYLPNTGAALVSPAPDQFLIISGEVKPGLRTDAVKHLRIVDNRAVWAAAHPLPKPSGAATHEGLAGAFSGLCEGRALVAGGTNFPGAGVQFALGQHHAHKNLTKHWATEIYALDRNGWQVIGHLPEGRAYGATFSLGDTVLIVGGEDSSGAARSDVLALTV